MSEIITTNMVMQAIEIARPSVESILNTSGTTWGPQYVQGYVFFDGLIDFPSFTIGTYAEGSENFWEVAEMKAQLSHRTGLSSREAAVLYPWLLEEGEWMYPGAVHFQGITVSASGAKGSADECIADFILSSIIMLSRLEAERRKEADEMQI